MSLKNKLAIVAILLLSGKTLQAQVIANSPYSSYGIGEIAPEGYSRNMGMGYTGVAAPTNEYINIINPALLFHNRLTTFETGIAGQYKRISNAEQSQRTGTMNIGHLGFAFPVAKRSSIAVGLRPYSSVNYSTYDSITVKKSEGAIESNVEQIGRAIEGKGGTNQALLAAGYDIGKGFSVGLQATYFFGTINSTTELYQDTLYTARFDTQTKLYTFTFKPSAAFRTKIRENTYFNAGATYEIASNTKSNRTRTTQRLIAGFPFGGDSTTSSGNVDLPNTLRLGLSINKPFHWTIAADVSYEEWSSYSSFGNEAAARNVINAGLGGEWTPNVNSIGNYFNKVTYRTGVYYNQMPFIIKDNRLNDFGINFGMSFPVNRNLSNLNVSVAAGQRGTTSESLIKEQYVRFNLGITLSDRWFIKNRID